MIQNDDNKDKENSIGTASMELDGTLVLTLRAEGLEGTIGDAQFRYETLHPQYLEILEHIGEIKPGETKQVPPWTQEESEAR
ncbi:MAG: hypothetical protein SVR94_08885 [Pseudomonadota bacterium]|nr:hypothetical protein [Pseudomonadota bacterium]